LLVQLFYRPDALADTLSTKGIYILLQTSCKSKRSLARDAHQVYLTTNVKMLWLCHAGVTTDQLNTFKDLV